MTHEEQEVAGTLRGFERRLEEILTLIDGPRIRVREEKARAQELLHTLKQDLNDLHRRLDTARGRAAMNAAERAYLAPTIHEASAAIRVRWNSNPSPQWFSELYDARTTISHTLHQLEDRAD